MSESLALPQVRDVGGPLDSVDDVLGPVEPVQPVGGDDGQTLAGPEESPGIVSSGTVASSGSQHGSEGLLEPVIALSVVEEGMESSLEGSWQVTVVTKLTTGLHRVLLLPLKHQLGGLPLVPGQQVEDGLVEAALEEGLPQHDGLAPGVVRVTGEERGDLTGLLYHLRSVSPQQEVGGGQEEGVHLSVERVRPSLV